MTTLFAACGEPSLFTSSLNATVICVGPPLTVAPSVGTVLELKSTMGPALSTSRAVEGPVTRLAFPPASVAMPAAMDMLIVPFPVMPLRVTVGLAVVPFVTVTVVAVAVPVVFRVTSPDVRLMVVAPEMVTAKSAGPVIVDAGTGAPIVTIGALVSYVTVLSVLVDAALPFPDVSVATPALIAAMTMPLLVMPVTATL